MPNDRDPCPWEWVELDRLVPDDRPICYGVLKPGPEHAEGVPLVRILDIEGNRVREAQLFRISAALDAQYRRSRLVGGELVISIQGTIGRVAEVPSSLRDANISRTLARVALGDQADAAFMRQWLISEAGQKALDDAVVGTTRSSLNLGVLRQIAVPHPLLPEQRRIAEILDAVDEAIQKTEQVLEKLKAMKRGLLHDLLTRGIDENGELRDPERHPEQFKDSPLGRIPKEWDVETTLEVAAPVPGSTIIGPFGSNLTARDYRGDGVPVVFVRDVREDGLEWQSNIYVSLAKARELRSHVVNPGDVVITKMGLPPGIAAVYDEMPPGIVTADIVRLTPDDSKVRSAWVAAYLNSSIVRRQVRAITGGVTRPKITLSDFRALRIALPTPTEQAVLLAAVEAANSQTRLEEALLEKLSLLKQGLMDDLLTGRVRVKVADEAA